MQDIYGPERDYGDICDEAYDKWKQADIERQTARRPGRIVAEFANGADALAFKRLKGATYTVTAGINYVFAVREVTP